MLAGQALTMGDTLLVSLIGMVVVMLELVLLALMIIVLAKVVDRLTGVEKAVQPAAQAAAPTVVDNTQEEETFAVLMSVICEDMKVPPEQLCFKEIKEIQ